MSKLIYNGITLELCRTVHFKVTDEKDESGTDRLWNVYRVRVIGIPILDGETGTAGAATIAAIKEKLATPRRAIQYQMNNGVAIFTTEGMDVAMGPEIDGEAVVTNVTSDAIFIEVGYKVCLRDCASGNFNPVVSLRWESTESFNQLHMAKIATSGTLVVRSDLGQSADNFRPLCTPPVTERFIRTVSEYRLSRDGTRCHFNFVDEEQVLMPPTGARKASGRFMVNVSKGSLRVGQVDIKLETGARGQSRQDLMVIGLKIAIAKLQDEGLLNSNLLDIKASESLWENSVDISISAKLSPVPTAAAAKAAGLKIAFFKTVGVNHGEEGPDKRDRAGLAPETASRVGGLLVALFRDPCIAAALDADPQLKTSPAGGYEKKLKSKGYGAEASGSAGTVSSITVSDLPFSSAVTLKDTIPYDTYLIESEYHYDSGNRVLPGTGVGPMPRRGAAIVVHGGQTTLEVTWTASRTGQPPVLPAMASGDPNFVFIDARLMPAQVELGADGVSPVHAVTGTYFYAALDPDQVAFAAPVPPFLADVVGFLAATAGTSRMTTDVLWKFRGQAAGALAIGGGGAAAGGGTGQQIING